MVDKINYITQNINAIENTSEIINYICSHNINHSRNTNGFFLNLSLLEDKFIDEIYKIIKTISSNEKYEMDIISIPNISDKKTSSKEYSPLKLNTLQESLLKYSN